MICGPGLSTERTWKSLLSTAFNLNSYNRRYYYALIRNGSRLVPAPVQNVLRSTCRRLSTYSRALLHRTVTGVRRIDSRVPGLVGLQGSFDRLDNAEEDREDQHRDRDPERVPLRPLTSIIPPLRECTGFCLVKYLFENGKTFSPKVEVINLSIIGSQPLTPDSSPVKAVQGLLFAIPFTSAGI